MVHSGKVYVVSLAPALRSVLPLFFTEFKVETNFCSLIDKRKIKPEINKAWNIAIC